MNESRRMKRICDWYMRNVGIIGALYATVPTLVWLIGALALVPFRSVYLLRVALTLAVGGPVGAFLNRYGVSLWITKHRSPKGPATLLDGAVIGAGVGMGCSVLPALTQLIKTNHPEQVKLSIIVVWCAAMAIGALVGLSLAAGGRTAISREWPAEGE